MKCDKCGGATHVTDVRHDEDNTYRKCVCKECGHITYTAVGYVEARESRPKNKTVKLGR